MTWDERLCRDAFDLRFALPGVRREEKDAASRAVPDPEAL